MRHHLLAALALAGCSGGQTSPQPSPAETPWEEARLRGVEFRAVGQTPRWVLEIDQGHSIRYTGDYGRTQVVAPDPGSGLYSNPGGGRIYNVRSEGRAVSVLVYQTGCADAMSGERFPYTVRVTVDRDWMDGCGRMLMTGDLIGVYWKLVELDGREVIEADPWGRNIFESIQPELKVHLRITDQGRAVTGGTGCKEFRGRAEIAGERVKLGPLATLIATQPAMLISTDSMTKPIVDTTTKSPCRRDLLDQEQRFLRALESANRLEAKIDTLTLYAGARLVGRFQAQYLR